MEILFIYHLKASGILVLFYGVYHILLKKETLFAGNRYFLLTGILAAMLLPLVHINRYITIELPAPDPGDTGQLVYSTAVADSGLEWQLLLLILYVVGVCLFFSRFLWQLVSLTRFLRKNQVRAGQGFVYVETGEPIAPFSFFKYIVYNPSLYKPHELEAILDHERAHCSQWHSLDILTAQLVAILLWINPVAWLYRKNIQQNLEFLADAEATRNIGSSLKAYQHTLLKVSGVPAYSIITNNFYSSLIKKRIVMLQKAKSNQQNSWKYSMVLPLILIFIMVFNTRVIAQHSTDHAVHENQDHMMMRVYKEMSDSALNVLKKEIKDKSGTFNYRGLKRNSAGEISKIRIEYRDRNGNYVNGSYDESEGIPPIYFGSNENGGIYITSNESMAHWQSGSKGHFIPHGDEHGQTSGSHKMKIKNPGDEMEKHMLWMNSGDGEEKKVEITEVDGKKTITINGKEVTEEEMKAMEDEDGVHKKVLRVKRLGDGQHKNIMIIRDNGNDENDNDIEVIDEKGAGYFYIDTDSNENTIYSIDGKESTREEVGALSPDRIEKIGVLQGEKAVSKYGKKAKEGIVEIVTKKKE